MTIFVKDRVYIPSELVKPTLLQKYYEFTIKNFDQTVTLIKLWSEEIIKGKTYIVLPSGDLERIERTLKIDLSDYEDKRKIVPMKHGLKWTGELHTGQLVDNIQTANQQKIVDEWMKTKSGVILAKARTGKSYIATNIICTLGLRTLIIAHQTEILKEFIKAFRSSTNLRKLRKETGKSIVKIVTKLDDIFDLDVALITYQKFIREDGPEKIKKYLKNFSVLGCDELHRGSASAYGLVLNRIQSRHKLGLTATNSRKDGKYPIIEAIMGPVTAESQDSSLIPHIELCETNLKPKYNYKNWTNGIKWLGSNKERNVMIVKSVFEKLRNGHTGVMIPVSHLEHMKTLVTMLNKQAAFNEKNKGEKWTKDGHAFSIGFHGKSNREVIKRDVNKGNHKVIVGIGKLIQEGITFPLISHIELVIPMSATNTIKEGGPAAYQQIYRACTPLKGKKPTVRIYVDKMGASIGSFRRLFKSEIEKRLEQPFKQQYPIRYSMSDKDITRCRQLVDNTIDSYLLSSTKKTGGRF